MNEPIKSRLDQLWERLGGVRIDTESGEEYTDDVILTESAVLDLIKDNIKDTDIEAVKKLQETVNSLKNEINNNLWWEE